MKKLLLITPLLLAGCATNYEGYAEANVKIAQARAQAESEKYKAMAAIASTGDAAAKDNPLIVNPTVVRPEVVNPVIVNPTPK